jgi:radical SAM superfamily enzyme YgiQ (UPF0313 family)
MKLLFVWPRESNLQYDSSDQMKIIIRLVSKVLFIRKPMTFSILAALTPEKYSIEIIERDFHDINFDKNYNLVGITCITSNAITAYQIADEFRRRGIPVVIGGHHPSALPEEAIQHADAVVIGEAEETWPELLKDLENNRLKSFYYQKRIVGPKIIPKPRDIYKSGTGVGIQATRGCPYKCEFCSNSHMKFGNVYRMRPVKDVIDDIKSHTGKLFCFQDNSLTINIKYTKKLFKELIGMNKKFFAYGNLNVLGKDEEFLKCASEAGCVGWLIGFESVCQKSIDSTGKKSNRVSEYLSSVKKIHDYGMIIEASFVFGFDYDTIDIFDKTDEFVRKSEVGIPFGLILTPYPGTSLYDRLDKEKRIFTKDWAKYDGQHVIFQPKHMTADELLINTEELSRKWHKNSRSIERIIKNMSFGFYPLAETLSLEIFWKIFYHKNDRLILSNNDGLYK